jgi:hypothetical protein
MDIKKSVRMVGITISILLICFLMLIVVLLLYSPGFWLAESDDAVAVLAKIKTGINRLEQH